MAARTRKERRSVGETASRRCGVSLGTRSRLLTQPSSLPSSRLLKLRAVECWITVDVTVLPPKKHSPDCNPMSKLSTKLAKLALRTLPAYPGPDYRPFDQITTEVGLRLARLAYDDESESGCGFLKYFEGKVIVSGGIIL